MPRATLLDTRPGVAVGAWKWNPKPVVSRASQRASGKVARIDEFSVATPRSVSVPTPPPA